MDLVCQKRVNINLGSVLQNPETECDPAILEASRGQTQQAK